MHSEDKLFTAPMQNEKVQIKGDAEIEGPVAYGSKEGKHIASGLMQRRQFRIVWTGKGSISVKPYMSLSFVLHVHDFAANLLSIGRITYELNC